MCCNVFTAKTKDSALRMRTNSLAGSVANRLAHIRWVVRHKCSITTNTLRLTPKNSYTHTTRGEPETRKKSEKRTTKFLFHVQCPERRRHCRVIVSSFLSLVTSVPSVLCSQIPLYVTLHYITFSTLEPAASASARVEWRGIPSSSSPRSPLDSRVCRGKQQQFVNHITACVHTGTLGTLVGLKPPC